MIKNIVFDIGNVILNFDLNIILPKFTTNKEEQKFIIDNIINSPEWLGYSLIDTGYITREKAIKIVEDRTNHIKDELIEKFWNNYEKYMTLNKDVLNLIKKLKTNGFKLYLLSNINKHTHNIIKTNDLFNHINGYVFSYIEHQVKPNASIYKTLINKYNLNPSETLFIDDNIKNIDTAKKMGFIAGKVKSDNYESIIEILKENKISILKEKMKGKYILNKNIKIEIATVNKMKEVLLFQNEIINNMSNKEWFCPLTKEEFLTPIKGKDNVYLLKYKNELIGIFVATCDIPKVLEEYKLENNNVLLIDSIMIKEEFRGHKLQKQILSFLYNRAKDLKVDGLVATVHPDNKYSLNNLLSEKYKIINQLTIHNGKRYIVYKKIK